MDDGLLGGNAAGRVIDEEVVEQVEAHVVQRGDNGGDVGLVPLGERGLEVGEGGDAGPVLLRGRTENAVTVSRAEGSAGDGLCVPEDLEDLVNLRVAREQRLAGAHLSKNAANRPHVDAGRVLAAAEQDLGRAVPQGDDLVGVCAERHAKGAGEPKIGELEVAVFVDEQVLRLEVAVQDAVGVAVAHALAQLHHELLDHGVVHDQCLARQPRALGQRLATAALVDGQRLHVLLEVAVEELKHQVQLVAVGVHNVEQAHNVRVVHLLEQRDLADGRRRHALVLGLEADLLERHDALVLGGEVARLVYDTVCALPNLLHLLVVFHGGRGCAWVLFLGG